MIAIRPAMRTASLGLALLAAACGGGGGSGGGSHPPAVLNIANETLDDGVIGMPYFSGVATTGGTGAKTFRISVGSLPPGLALNTSSGSITGTPTGPAGTSDVTVSVTDSGSPAQTDSQALTVRIATPLSLDIGVPPMAVIGTPYNHTLSASGGTPPYSFFSGSLPSGIVLDAAGVIGGTPLPDARSVQTFVNVPDSATPPQIIGASFRLPVALRVATTALPDATGGVDYFEFLNAQGGFPNFAWTLTGGSLPAGINPSILTGQIRGTPVASCAPATSTFDISVSDSDTPAQTATGQGITLTVIKGPLSIPPAALPVGRVGVAYSAFIRPALGVLPYSFAVSSGALPSQLTLNAATGQISGTPDVEGTQNFTIQVTDACGTTASAAFNLVVGAAPQGRNNSTATATAIGNGTFFASISPSGHPNTVFQPDQDYYAITTFAASTVTVDLTGQGGEIDTVMEIVDAAGNRLNTCIPPAFTSACVNDDEEPGVSLDSYLVIRVAGPTTFYVRVLDWRFDGRPDMRYTITISGVN